MTTSPGKTTKTNNEWLDFQGKDFDKQQEMDYSYTNIDKLIRLSLGENASYSNAWYDGDYSISLEEAQIRKYKFICENLHIGKGSKVLDLGCGWGGFLKYLEEISAQGTGVNLSKGQVAACLKNGLNVHLKDVRLVKPADFGVFDAVTAMGCFEHLVSFEQYLNGLQDEVYDRFFKQVADLLKKGSRFYLQSMVFSKNMVPFDAIDINAPKDSNAYIMALLIKHFPNSWAPYGGEHIIRTAAPYFKLIHHSSGRLDYIETNRQWTKRFYRFNLKKYLWFLSFVPKYLTDKEFRYQLDILKIRPNRVCFEREIMDHSRIVFEKI